MDLRLLERTTLKPSVCCDHSQFGNQPPTELSQQSAFGDDTQVETQPPQITIVIHSPSEPNLQSVSIEETQLESQLSQKTSPESVSLEDSQFERQLLESGWVIIEAKDLPGYEDTAEVQSPTSGDLPEEEAAAADSDRVLIDYSVPIDLEKMKRERQPSEEERRSRKRNICLCTIVIIVFIIAVIVVTGSIYALTVFDH